MLLDSTFLVLLEKAWMWESTGVSQAGLLNIPRGRSSHGMEPWASTAIADWPCQSSAEAQRSSGTPTQAQPHSPVGPERVPLDTSQHYCSSSLQISNGSSAPVVSENKNSFLRVKDVRSERWRAKVQIGEGQATKSKLELNKFWRLLIT